MGREVATLVNEELEAGNHHRLWNASNISSGVYFYRIKVHTTDGKRVGIYMEIKKLLFLK